MFLSSETATTVPPPILIDNRVCGMKEIGEEIIFPMTCFCCFTIVISGRGSRGNEGKAEERIGKAKTS